MKLRPFQVHRPTSLGEACALLSELSEDAVAYSGGTELLLAMKLGLADYGHLVDLKAVAELNELRLDGGLLAVGAGVTHRRIETAREVRAALPSMASMIAGVANLRVRSVGTIGGNLCFADPHSDPATFLTATGAALVCGDGRGLRRLAVGEFLHGPYENDLAAGELLLGVEVPVPAPGVAISHLRMRLHERPAVTVTAVVELRDGEVSAARVAVGSVSGTPRLVEVQAHFARPGRTSSQSGSRAAAEQVAASVEPVEDAEGSVAYKSALVEVLTSRALEAAIADAGRLAA